MQCVSNMRVPATYATTTLGATLCYHPLPCSDGAAEPMLPNLVLHP
jgi:hypothetical protein